MSEIRTCDRQGLVEPRPCRPVSGRPLPGATRLARDAAGALEASRAGPGLVSNRFYNSPSRAIFSAKPSTPPAPISAAYVLGSHAEFCKGHQGLEGAAAGVRVVVPTVTVICSILLKIGKG